MIYLRQTGTRDIQYRLEKILKDAGVRAQVLTSGVEARKREAWIAGKVFGIDALIVNPRLVETGLDLSRSATWCFLKSSLVCTPCGRPFGGFGDQVRLRKSKRYSPSTTTQWKRARCP